MRTRFSSRLSSAAMGTLVLLLASCAGIQSQTSKHPYHEHMPSANTMERARRAYEAGMHRRALEHYREAAVWADKFAQYNVGVMHLRGEGTEFDPVRAWAWIELAAERDYPEFIETAEDLYAMLDEAQRRRAREIYEQELLPKYGDARRVPRTARKMRSELRNATGSRTGSQAFLSRLTIIDGSGITRSGDEFYAPEKWNFQRLMEFESNIMIDYNRGSVELRDLELVDEEEGGAETEEEP